MSIYGLLVRLKVTKLGFVQVTLAADLVKMTSSTLSNVNVDDLFSWLV